MARAAHVALTAALGVVGGGLFVGLNLPAAWLAGSMTLVAGAALAGAPVAMPGPLRNGAFVLLGTSMGAAVTPETVASFITWPVSIALLAASIVATLLFGTVFLERRHRWDPATARFSSVPGALSSVLILAATSQADLPRVALAQSVRLFTLVALMPSLVNFWGADPATLRAAVPAVAGPLPLIASLALSAAASLLLHRLRVPGGMLLGAMVASAVLHGTGLVVGRPPGWMLVIGFVATGAVIGARFRGTPLDTMRRTLRPAFESVLLALFLSAAFALGGAWLTGLPFGQVWLAFAPGGIEAMAVMALALDVDPAFVGAHHVLRIMALGLTSPWWGRPRTPS